MRQYSTYILASITRRLYVGVTSDLVRRLWQHRADGQAFTQRYRITRLVHVELFSDVRAAIAREKQLKGWSRKKKIALIEIDNPNWLDLAETESRPSEDP